MATTLGLKYCKIYHDSTYYDVIVGVTTMDQVNDILQEWALTSDGPGEALTLPGELVQCVNAETVNLTQKTLDSNVYIATP